MKEKLVYNFADIQRSIEFLEKKKEPYRLTLTNYTTRIESKYYDRHYLAKKQNPKVFSAFNKIKKDLTEWSANEKPVVRPEEMVYFNHNFRSSGTIKKIFATDIKSAYATVLLNDGFISIETYNYISELDKEDRLACVGMLAAKKDFFYFDGHELNYAVEDKSEFTPYFHYCVKRTAEIMSGAIKAINKEAALFYWVDCIFCWIDQQAELRDYLDSLKYNYTQSEYFRLSIEEMQDHFFASYYKKDNPGPDDNPSTVVPSAA